jgi:hypothetical protein|tara:strand:+ start:61 stop:357 length:297 start_codon:yes stop_codon:yes gene_type:complete
VSIKVKAKIMGYYGAQRRRPGDIFEIEKESDRGSWMIDVNDELPPEKNAMPFTSNIQGTRAGGNIYNPKKDPWEEPVGESKVVPDLDKTKKKSPKRRR